MVKNVTTVGVFSLVFLFNMIMLGVMVQRVLSLRHNKEVRVNLHSAWPALLVFTDDPQDESDMSSSPCKTTKQLTIN